MKRQYGDNIKFFRKLGERVKFLRLENGLTQEDMFERGFSIRFYQRIEAGKPIHLKTVLKLADSFNISIERLFRGL